MSGWRAKLERRALVTAKQPMGKAEAEPGDLPLDAVGVSQVVSLRALLVVEEDDHGGDEVDDLASGQQVHVGPAVFAPVAVPSTASQGDTCWPKHTCCPPHQSDHCSRRIHPLQLQPLSRKVGPHLVVVLHVRGDEHGDGSTAHEHLDVVPIWRRRQHHEAAVRQADDRQQGSQITERGVNNSRTCLKVTMSSESDLDTARVDRLNSGSGQNAEIKVTCVLIRL